MRLLCFLFGVVLLTACDKDQTVCKEPPSTDDAIIFKSGVICGWCAANDTVVIAKNSASVKAVRQCDSLAFYTLENDDSYYQPLISKLSLQEFLSIQLNSCEVCADGCDHWISIQNNDTTHLIRYGFKDSAAIAPILPLIQEMDEQAKSLGYVDPF